MNHIRHSGIYDASRLSVTLIGAGGIGAMTAVTLAKMGVGYLEVYDDDLVSDENLATQFHRLNDRGRAKVYAVQDTLRQFADDTVLSLMNQSVTAEEDLYAEVIVSAVDSIAARKEIWQAVKRCPAKWYIDARMAAEEYHQYAVDLKGDWAWYEAIISREEDSRVAELPCTAKATFFTSAISAGQIGAAIRKIVTGLIPPRYLVHNILQDQLITIPGEPIGQTLL